MKKRILVVGGYGAVGTSVSRHLARDPRVELIVGGRSEEKARALAAEIGGAGRAIDALAPAAGLDAIGGVDAIVNCFIDLDRPSLALAEAAADRGLLYLDVAGIPTTHADAVLALRDRAAASGATLVTALGCNPGIPSLMAMDCRARFETIDDVEFFFALGSRLDGLSVLSLMGVGRLMNEPALVWSEGAWGPQRESSRKRAVGAPFDKQVYFGPAYVTRDLIGVPAAIGAKRVAFWSGIEDTLQGMVFILGVKLGGTKKPERAARMLRWLQALGGKSCHLESTLEMIAKGTRDGRPATRVVRAAASEEHFTALSPAIVAQQWLDGELPKAGAFVGPDVVPASSFLERLAKEDVRWSDTWS